MNCFPLHGETIWRRIILCIIVLGLLASSAANARPMVDVTTYHNDLGRTGLNPDETLLTPQTVKSGLFGWLFAYPVDGYVYAQPLYLSRVTIPHLGSRDIVIVATEHDSVYAFDADAESASDPIWKVSFLDPTSGVTSVPYGDIDSTDLQPEIGITGTPVIDRVTNTIYVVAKTKQIILGAARYAFHLHALDVETGAERPGSPVRIDAAFPGTSWDSVKGTIAFNAQREHDRMGLLLLNGAVYVAFASHSDTQPYHGWLLGYDEKTLKQVSVFNTTPVSGLGGIWEGGGAPTADSNGNIYVSTGNADFDASKANYGDSVIKLSTQGGKLSVLDYFAPFNQDWMNRQDVDLGSGAVMLLPRDAMGSVNGDEIITAGKEGKLYVLDSDKLGGYDPATDHVLQSISGLGSLFACPAYFDGTIYYPGCSMPLEALSVANGRLSNAPVAAGAVNLGGRAATPSVSSSGSHDGIVWIVQVGVPGTLFAFDAADALHELYRSESGAIPEGIKFSAPTIANGRVFVGSSNCLVVFGLLDKATNPPPRPRLLTATNVTNSTVALNWSEPAGANIAACRVECAEGSHIYELCGTAARDQRTFMVTCLNPGVRYRFRVVGVNSYADSQPSVSIAVRTARIAEEKGLVGYWPLDDGQGDVARDPIDTLAKGAVEGEYTWIRANGIGETALELHGSGNAPSQVVVSDNAKMRFSGLQSFTWSIDVDPTTPIRRAESILSKARLSSAWIDLGIDSGGKWSLAGPLGALLGSVATEGRHMLIAVQDAKTGTRYLYVDGNLAATGPSQAADGAGDLWIGGSEQGGDGFKGRVSLVRVYARALSASDVSALSHAP